MRAPRFTTRTLAFAVVVVAVDCAVIPLMPRATIGLAFGLSGAFVMGNVLAVQVHRLVSRPESRTPFRVGFLVAGTFAVLAWLNLCLAWDDPELRRLNNWLLETIELKPASWLWPDYERVYQVVRMVMFLVHLATVFLVPFLVQLAFAHLGGRSALWLRARKGRGREVGPAT